MVQPSYLIGHSIGAYVAACISGIYSLEDAVKIVSSRGNLVQLLPENTAMATILTNKEKVISMIKELNLNNIYIAAINNENNITISGIKNSIEKIIKHAKKNKIFTEMLSISHAFHSPFIEPVLKEFEKTLRTVSFSIPKIPIISDLTGKKLMINHNYSKYWLNILVTLLIFMKQ